MLGRSIDSGRGTGTRGPNGVAVGLSGLNGAGVGQPELRHVPDERRAVASREIERITYS